MSGYIHLQVCNHANENSGDDVNERDNRNMTNRRDRDHTNLSNDFNNRTSETTRKK